MEPVKDLEAENRELLERVKKAEREKAEEVQRRQTAEQEKAEEVQRRQTAEQEKADEVQRRQTAEQEKADEVQRRQKAEERLELSTFHGLLKSSEEELFGRFKIEPEPALRATLGTTKVGGKLYPVSLKQWTAFSDVHRSMFQQLEAAFGTRRLFASPHQMDYLTRHISPDGLKNEYDLRSFFRTAIEFPAKDILESFFRGDESDVRRITFRNSSTGFTPVPSGSEDRSGASTEQAGPPPSKRRSPEKEIQPDRWGVLVKESGDEVNCFVGEHKAAHKLKAATVQAVLGKHPGDDFFAQVHGRKEQRAASRPRAGPSEETPRRSSPLPPEPKKSSPNRSRSSSPGSRKGEVLVAMVLCQAFDYMIRSGLSCGYVASGSALLFLHVLTAEPTVLYYFPVIFTTQNEGQSRQLQHTAVAYLCTFCMFAVRQTRRSAEWIDHARGKLPKWPADTVAEPKRLLKVAFGCHTTVHSRRDDGDDDDGGDGDGDNDNNNDNPGSRLDSADSEGARGRSPSKRKRDSTINPQPASRSGGSENQATNWIKQPSIPQRPTLPFCTQACLSGLCRGLAIDANCPNAALHAKAAIWSPSATSKKHPLTAAGVCANICAQLGRNLDDNCECWEQVYGATGVLFKLTVAGYGYTFVAKGSPAMYRAKLDREAAVYGTLEAHQGNIIPVCLGRVHLQREYSLSTLVEITDMLLLSWAGKMVRELDAEAERTQEELERAGLLDDDFREANVVWNEERQRAIRIDLGDSWVLQADSVLGKRGRGDSDEGDKENWMLSKKSRVSK